MTMARRLCRPQGRSSEPRPRASADLAIVPQGVAQLVAGLAVTGVAELVSPSAQPAVRRRCRRRWHPGSGVVWWERRAAHSLVCSTTTAPTRHVIAASFGKIPTTSVRRLISAFGRLTGFVLCGLARCRTEKVV